MKNFFRPIVVLTVICLVIVSLLSVTYQVTKPYIDAAKLAATNKALVVVFPGDYTFEINDTDTGDSRIAAVYTAKDGSGNVAGYIFTVDVKGYGGTVETMVGVDSTGAVSGVTVTSQNETPGVGAKATVADYLSQYVGMTTSDPELISGATITSTAIKNAVQAALDANAAMTGGTAAAAANPEGGEG